MKVVLSLSNLQLYTTYHERGLGFGLHQRHVGGGVAGLVTAGWLLTRIRTTAEVFGDTYHLVSSEQQCLGFGCPVLSLFKKIT